MNKTKVFLIILTIICGSSSAFTDESIKIAGIYSLEKNKISIKGVTLGVEEINQRGGVLGKKIDLLIIDNQGTPIGSNIAAEKAHQQGVVAIIGPGWSSHALATAKVAQEHQIPMISNIATNPKVTKIGNFIFRVCFTDDFQGKIMAHFAWDTLNAKRAVIFTDVASDYSMMLSRRFLDHFKGLGGEVLFEQKYKHNQDSFENLVTTIKKTAFDVLFISGHYESGKIIKQVQDQGTSMIPIGGDGWMNEAFFKLGGDETKKGYYCTHWSENKNSDLSRAFVKKYRGPDGLFSGTALGYDAVLLLADAIKRAGTTEPEKLRKAIQSTIKFNGITGPISFNANGDPIKEAVIMEIRNGESHFYKTVKP